MSSLDNVGPLVPVFAAERDPPSPRSGCGVTGAPDKEQRRKAFFERRGVPYPPPRPSWAAEVDRQSFNEDWQATQREARRAAFKALRQGPSREEELSLVLRTSFARTLDR